MTCTFYVALVTALSIIFNCPYPFYVYFLYLSPSVLNFTLRRHFSFPFFLTAYKLSLQEATNCGLKVSRMTGHVTFTDSVTSQRYKPICRKD